MADPNPIKTGRCQPAQSNVTLQAVDGLVRAGGFSQPGEMKAQLVLIQPKENPAYARFQEGRQVLGPLLYIGQLGLDIPAALQNNTFHWQRKMSQSYGVGSNPFKPLRPYSPHTFEGRVNRRLFLPRKFHDLLLSEDKLAELRNSVRRNRFKGNVFALLERGTRLGTDVSALLSADYQNAGGREFIQYGAIALDGASMALRSAGLVQYMRGDRISNIQAANNHYARAHKSYVRGYTAQAGSALLRLLVIAHDYNTTGQVDPVNAAFAALDITEGANWGYYSYQSASRAKQVTQLVEKNRYLTYAWQYGPKLRAAMIGSGVIFGAFTVFINVRTYCKIRDDTTVSPRVKEVVKKSSIMGVAGGVLTTVATVLPHVTTFARYGSVLVYGTGITGLALLVAQGAYSYYNLSDD